ncbi:MAG: hypothetical protein JJ902_05590 [Roseibium sp.]|nr:hypothetical protein [Roseibium sp.]
MRWKATIYYRTDNGTIDIRHILDELADIHEYVERGPHWDTIERVVIERINHITNQSLTVEQAERL